MISEVIWWKITSSIIYYRIIECMDSYCDKTNPTNGLYAAKQLENVALVDKYQLL